MRYTPTTYPKFLIVVSIFFAISCDHDPMRNGADALYSADYDLAEKEFKAALAQDKDNLEAKRRLADVELARKNYAEAEKILNEIAATLPEQGRNTSLTIDQKVLQNLITQQYTRLYSSWIDIVDRSTDPDIYKHIFTEGNKYAPADATLNAAGVSYYTAIADQFVNDGKELLAIENYRFALNFSMPNETKHKIEGEISKAERTNFDKAFSRQFERAKAELQPPFSWNEEQSAIEITIKMPRDTLKSKDLAPETIKLEAAPQIDSLIRKLITIVSPLPSGLDISDLFVPKYRFGDIEIKRRFAMVHAFVTPSEIASSTFLSIAKYDKSLSPTAAVADPTSDHKDPFPTED